MKLMYKLTEIYINQKISCLESTSKNNVKKAEELSPLLILINRIILYIKNQ